MDKTISPSSTPDIAAAEPPPTYTISVNKDEPVTQLRLALVDGRKVPLTINHTHTVQNLFDHIRTMSGHRGSFKLIDMASFPRKELKDFTQTIKAANLLNGSVQQSPS